VSEFFHHFLQCRDTLAELAATVHHGKVPERQSGQTM
jgi:hypothetical protein